MLVIELAIKNWMRYNYQYHDNATELAENCAWALDQDQWLDDPDHIIWDIALDYTAP